MVNYLKSNLLTVRMRLGSLWSVNIYGIEREKIVGIALVHIEV